MRPWQESQGLVRYTPDTVHYDRITARLQGDMRDQNRVALIVQGLLDRSPVLHPHPTYRLWTPEGFRAALELVYDESRALAPADLPDFEAYRAKLNASIGKGSITIGQEYAWARAEAVKENARMARSRAHPRYEFEVKTHFPYGNPGPGLLAEVESFSKAQQTCTFVWQRERSTFKHGAPETLRTSFTVPVKKLLNVSAYQPGDYRQFFADPRTREQYLKWAPLLLAAEDYLAGQNKVGKRGRR